eukprot:Gb_38276 [translate_table: standard]
MNSSILIGSLLRLYLVFIQVKRRKVQIQLLIGHWELSGLIGEELTAQRKHDRGRKNQAVCQCAGQASQQGQARDFSKINAFRLRIPQFKLILEEDHLVDVNGKPSIRVGVILDFVFESDILHERHSVVAVSPRATISSGWGRFNSH